MGKIIKSPRCVINITGTDPLSLWGSWGGIILKIRKNESKTRGKNNHKL